MRTALVHLVNPASCALFVVTAFMLSGLCQAMWLASPASRPFAVPIDGGLTFRGRRLFGDNKTLRGFIVMVPATTAAFCLLWWFAVAPRPAMSGLWPLGGATYALLGLVAGIGFMAGELPNSFVKRQLDIEPGAPASGSAARALFFVVDHVDSAAGATLALSLVVPVPWQAWIYIALVGPILHGAYSVLLFQLGGKARAA